MPPPRPGAARMAGAAAMTPLGWGSGSARATAKTTMATKANKNSLNMLNRFLYKTLGTFWYRSFGKLSIYRKTNNDAISLHVLSATIAALKLPSGQCDSDVIIKCISVSWIISGYTPVTAIPDTPPNIANCIHIPPRSVELLMELSVRDFKPAVLNRIVLMPFILIEFVLIRGGRAPRAAPPHTNMCMTRYGVYTNALIRIRILIRHIHSDRSTDKYWLRDGTQRGDFCVWFLLPFLIDWN